MFDLTREERKVVMFLLSMALAGIGLGFIHKKNIPPAKFFYIDEALTRIDLNKAGVSQILLTKSLPRNLAERLVQYRTQQGPFRTLEEVKKVKGIGARRYEKLKEFFFVD